MSPPSPSTTTQRKCFNLIILFLAFTFPIYTSNVFSSPPTSQLSSHTSHQNSNENGIQTSQTGGKERQDTMPSLSNANMNSNKEKVKMNPPLFILDFDSTITTSDTISALFESAVEFHSQTGKKGMHDKLDWILEEYKRDLKKSVPLISRPEGGFESVEGFVKYQRGLKVVEERSFARVSDSGILGRIGEERWMGLGREALEGGNVTVREGWRGFVDRVGRSWWGVVSVNFCEGWVRGVLGLEVGDDRVEVLANRPNWEGVLSSGVEGGGVMVDSEGKRDAMRGIVKRLSGGEERTVVYIGDSATDVECLLEDGVVGVVMTKKDGTSALLDILREFGDVKSVREFDGNDEARRKPLVYFARDFNEISESPLFIGMNRI